MSRVQKGSRELYELSCLRKTETAHAVLIHDFASKEDIWIPLSQVEELHFNDKGEGSIVMTAWIAKQKGLI